MNFFIQYVAFLDDWLVITSKENIIPIPHSLELYFVLHVLKVPGIVRVQLIRLLQWTISQNAPYSYVLSE